MYLERVALIVKDHDEGRGAPWGEDRGPPGAASGPALSGGPLGGSRLPSSFARGRSKPEKIATGVAAHPAVLDHSPEETDG